MDFHDFEGILRQKWEPKRVKNQFQNEVGQGMRPGIDFHAMLVNFGFQNGAQIC